MKYVVLMIFLLASNSSAKADLKNYVPIWDQVSKLICNGGTAYDCEANQCEVVHTEEILVVDFDKDLITWLNFDNVEEINYKYFLWGPLFLPQLSKHVLFLEGRLLQFMFDDRVHTNGRDWIPAATVQLSGGNSIFQEVETSTTFYRCYPKSKLVPS